MRLSADGAVSCQSCHVPSRYFSDGRARALGTRQLQGTRNTPSLLNVAYVQDLFWDGRAVTLEEQAALPFFNSREMALPSPAALLARVRAFPEYAELIRDAYREAPEQLQLVQVAQAIAAYERTLLAGRSPFDQYEYGGDTMALSAPAIRGLQLFRARARCATCHSIGPTDTLFSDQGFHTSPLRIPAAVLGKLPSLTATIRTLRAMPSGEALNAAVSSDPDVAALGRYLATLDPHDIGSFRTPSLRNVAMTAPYMHDGSVLTLEKAIELEAYGRGAGPQPPVVLTTQDKQDLLAFLRALTSPVDMQPDPVKK